MRRLALSLLAACGSSQDVSPDAAPVVPVEPTPNATREILHTKLAVDVTTRQATASITFAASDAPGATLEVGNEMVMRATLDGAELAFARPALAIPEIALALPASTTPLTVEIAYQFALNEFEGASKNGFTLVWPYHCGNLFPCHSAPADGTTFELALTGVPEGATAVYPTAITSEAPSYQIAWAYDAYVEMALGATAAGTELVVYHLASQATAAASGAANLRASFEWLEQTIGPYKFGPKAGGVAVRWGQGALGGMEHHPFWHVGSGAIGDQETQVHEAAHGWYGDGIRLRCWEDFVLSEGTTTYLAGRALDVVAPEVGAQVWASYESELRLIGASEPVWPQSCGTVDILEDNLFSRAPYIRGAFFYRALAQKLGADKVDEVLAAFYAQYALQAASMSDMLTTIQQVTGYDPTACAERWLRATTKPTVGPCP